MKRIAGALLMGLLLVSCGSQQVSDPSQATASVLPAVQAEEQVIAEAKVVPIESAELRFLTEGFIAEIVVDEGQTVKKGQALARLDTRDLELAVAQAKADQSQAQADLDKLIAGATPEEIAAAEAALAQAQGQFERTSGEVTDADITAAQASIDSARATLNDLLNGEDASTIAAAQASVASAQAVLNNLLDGPEQTLVAVRQAAVEQAQSSYNTQAIGLQQTRDLKSKAKTDAELALQEATIALEKAQSDYSVAYWNYTSVVDRDRASERNEREANPELTDYGNLEQQEAFRKAELALKDAETKQEQARVNLELARQDEVTSIQEAESQLATSAAQVREAQANLEDLLRGADYDDIEQARATLADAEDRLAQVLKGAEEDELARARSTLASAEANLQQLLGQSRSGSLAAAAANTADFEARLADLQAPARVEDVASAKARVQRAEVQVKQAEVTLDKALLRAPIDGTVVEVNLEIGERPSATSPALIIANLSQLEIETDDLTELQIVYVEEGAPVTITFDAIPGFELPGKVTRIKDIGENKQGDITYTVTVVPDRLDPRLRWNMTATVAIERVNNQ